MSRVRRVQVFSNTASPGVRRQGGARYATLAGMQRSAVAPFTTRPQLFASAWLARRWYYTPRSHRAYSVRQISPGDRRLLAEFALDLTHHAAERERDSVRELCDLLFDQVIGGGTREAAGFAALENTLGGDRVIGVCVCSAPDADGADFRVAVARTHREEQIGKTLMAALLRHARRIGVARLSGEMHWSNRPMQVLALSMGFAIEAVPRDRNLRRLVLALR